MHLSTGQPRLPNQVPPTLSVVEEWLDYLYVAAEGATLREEDRRKAQEVTALLAEIARALDRMSQNRPLLVVDAAAGKAFVGVLAAALVIEPLGRTAKVIALERDPVRTQAALTAAQRLVLHTRFEVRAARVEDPTAWPERPDVVVGLHACGPASDAIIEQAAAHQARLILLVPCCTGANVSAVGLARTAAEAIGIPRHAGVRTRFVQSIVDAWRTLWLESLGYETEVVEFVPPTVTPHNLLWRSRRVGEERRMASAREALARLATLGQQHP